MIITGQKDTEGKFMPFTKEIPVNNFGGRLICNSGICWAIKDSYGDWVSPNMHKLGLKCIVVLKNN